MTSCTGVLFHKGQAVSIITKGESLNINKILPSKIIVSDNTLERKQQREL